MVITPEMLLDVMRVRWDVAQYGRAPRSEPLPLPVFYTKGEAPQKGALYIARASDLPHACAVSCLFVCVSKRPIQTAASWRGTVFCVNDEVSDLFSVFNYIQAFFQRVSQWIFRMQELLDQDAELKELAREGIVFFENGIAITDHALQLLVYGTATLSEGRLRAAIMDKYEYVPSGALEPFVATFLEKAAMREPFFFKGHFNNDANDMTGSNYCINLYLGKTYMGCCTLYDSNRPMRESDYALFGVFVDFVRQYFQKANVRSDSSVITVKTIFDNLLQSFPVSAGNLGVAMGLLQHNLAMNGEEFQCWSCVVLQSANRGKILPEQYICRSLESLLPFSAALSCDESIVLFSAVPLGKTAEDAVYGPLLPYLKDMNFQAGASVPFTNIYEARDYYLQALSVLELGRKAEPKAGVYHFADYVLPYLLDRACGEFSPKMLLTPGLRELRDSGGTVDHWDTLRQYLNNECNASETARKMFLHRSTLLTRLEWIRQRVDIDDPDTRMYLRIMTRLLP